MPNGYTAAIYEGKDVSLRDYLMTVGRAFGFAVLQRDEPLSEPIREQPESDYYAESLRKRQDELARLDALTPEQVEERAREAYEAEVRDYEETLERNSALRARYDGMIAQVEEWEPLPLVAETEIKATALQYLRESRDFDCASSARPRPERLQANEWLVAERTRLTRAVEYAAKSRREDLERTADRNRFIRAFLDSLPPAKTRAAA